MALCSSVTSLTVALACNSVTAAVSVPTVACFCTVCPPVACITGCDRNITFDIIWNIFCWQVNKIRAMTFCLRCCNYFPAPLPFRQLCPVQPGAQVHRPLTASQRALFSQTHFIWHPWPKRPLGHAAQEKKKDCMNAWQVPRTDNMPSWFCCQVRL